MKVAGLFLLLLMVLMIPATGRSQSAPPVLKSANNPAAQQQSLAAKQDSEVDEDDVVRVSTSLITVPAQVMDRSGRYIGNLRRQDFQIFENGVEQELSYFGAVDQPFTVALLLDVSGSTQTQLTAIRTAANAFIGRLRPNDQILIVSFDGKINVLTEAVQVSALRKLKLRLDAVNDGTVLYDAVDVALNKKLAAISGRKAIVLLTDGVDEGSRQATRKQNLRDADESDVVIYTVQYNTLPQLPERLSRIPDARVKARLQSKLERDYAAGSTYLRGLAEKTGGRLYPADTLGDINQSFAAITNELGRQYSLGYYPKGQVRAGEKRDIRVRLRIPNLVVRARDSYIANGASAAKGSE